MSNVENGFSLDKLDSLKNLDGLGSLIFTKNFSLYGCRNLSDLSGLNNNFETSNLVLSGNDNITTLEGLSNIDFTEIEYISLAANRQLSDCAIEKFCEFLRTNPSNAIVNSNSVGCNSKAEVIALCEGTSSILSTYIFLDDNKNQILDTNEYTLPFIYATINPGDISVRSLFNRPNNILLEEGAYNISVDTNVFNQWELTTDSSLLNINVTFPKNDTVYFGLYPKENILDSKNSLDISKARCNEFANITVRTTNTGTLSNDGILWLEIDSAINEVLAFQSDTSILPYTYGWYYQNLKPGYSFDRKLIVRIPGPPEFELGDSIYFSTYSILESGTINGFSDTFNYALEVKCAYDPNDKLVNPNRSASYDENYTLFEEDLTYTIRFQNTGNAEAFDVVILDTLDDNLNVETFQVLATSHPDVLSTSITEGKYISFDFKNIFLPDSTSDFEGSQGYVTYLIEPFNGLAENTSITNSASIYFDQNPPIHTNTTENVMVSELPTSVSVFGVEEVAGFSVFPNPTHDVVRLEAERFGDYWFEVFDLTGRQLTSGFFQQATTLDLENFSSGIYLLSVYSTDGKWTSKLIKQ